MSTDHDSSYKILFSHPELIRDLLLEFVDVSPTEPFDFASLSRVNGSYVSDTGKVRHSDMVWKIKFAGTWLYIYLLLEFQSESDPIMALRMQVYVGLLLQDLDRRKEYGPTGKLPPVLPMVLHSGLTPWRAPIDLVELLEPVPARFQPFQPSQRYWLIDESRYDFTTPIDTVPDSKTNLVAALFRLKHFRQHEDTQRLLTRLREWLADPQYLTLRQDFAIFLSWQLRGEYNDPTIPITPDLTKVQTMHAEKHIPLWQQWKHEGRLEGEARLLHRQLEHRFGKLPDWVETKLGTATEGNLVRWGEGIIDAKTLDELFTR